MADLGRFLPFRTFSLQRQLLSARESLGKNIPSPSLDEFGLSLLQPKRSRRLLGCNYGSATVTISSDRECPLWVATSTGQRNTLAKSFCRCLSH